MSVDGEPGVSAPEPSEQTDPEPQCQEQPLWHGAVGVNQKDRDECPEHRNHDGKFHARSAKLEIERLTGEDAEHEPNRIASKRKPDHAWIVGPGRGASFTG